VFPHAVNTHRAAASTYDVIIRFPVACGRVVKSYAAHEAHAD